MFNRQIEIFIHRIVEKYVGQNSAYKILKGKLTLYNVAKFLKTPSK